MLQIYNTITQQKEFFKPLQPKKIGMYVCGLTVYDDCHIGHGRLFVWFDVVVRYLRSIGYEVVYVRNITDIDDKIIKRANELNVDCKTLTDRVITAMHADEAKLKILSPDFEPRVSEHLPQIINLIQTLVDKGFAYVTPAGDVYFEVAKFKNYGQLAHQDLESLQAGTRIEINPDKRAPLDFALWKAAKPNEPFWPSPWGNGRPGWHIECSAMAKHYLGEQFDIHGGGSDLQFPHHQNELAQSEAANNCRFVNYWMHMGFVQVDQAKMSKSLGNFFTLKEVLKQYHPEVLRYFIIASHYRSPINYSQENLENAHAALARLYLTLRDLPAVSYKNLDPEDEFNQRFNAKMDDDFNTPEALAVIFDLARTVNRLRDANKISQAARYAAQLRNLGKILGLLQSDPEQFLQSNSDAKQIQALIDARTLARQQKNWAEADRIRKQLAEIQIAIEDTSQGTTWRRS